MSLCSVCNVWYCLCNSSCLGSVRRVCAWVTARPQRWETPVKVGLNRCCTENSLRSSYLMQRRLAGKCTIKCGGSFSSSKTKLRCMSSCRVGVYLSRYSDLLQVDPLIPGATGEIIIFKVMKVNQIISQTQNM